VIWYLVQFGQIADHAPIRGFQNESLSTRFRHWVKHKDTAREAVWPPFARAVLAGLAHAPLTIVLDGTTAGRGCMVLIAGVVYHGADDSVALDGGQGQKGHLPQDEHCTLITRLQTVIPNQTRWWYSGMGGLTARSCSPRCARLDGSMCVALGSTFPFMPMNRVFKAGDLPLKRGEANAIADVKMTTARYGSALLAASGKPIRTRLSIWSRRWPILMSLRTGIGCDFELKACLPTVKVAGFTSTEVI
jgi:hypothetical protein